MENCSILCVFSDLWLIASCDDQYLCNSKITDKIFSISTIDHTDGCNPSEVTRSNEKNKRKKFRSSHSNRRPKWTQGNIFVPQKKTRVSSTKTKVLFIVCLTLINLKPNHAESQTNQPKSSIWDVIARQGKQFAKYWKSQCHFRVSWSCSKSQEEANSCTEIRIVLPSDQVSTEASPYNAHKSAKR